MANWGIAIARGLGLAIDTENKRFAEERKENRVLAKQRFQKTVEQADEQFETQAKFRRSYQAAEDNVSRKRALLAYQAQLQGYSGEAANKFIESGLTQTTTLDDSVLFSQVKRPTFDPDGYKRYLASVDRDQYPLTKLISQGAEAAKDQFQEMFGEATPDGMATEVPGASPQKGPATSPIPETQTPAIPGGEQPEGQQGVFTVPGIKPPKKLEFIKVGDKEIWAGDPTSGDIVQKHSLAGVSEEDLGDPVTLADSSSASPEETTLTGFWNPDKQAWFTKLGDGSQVELGNKWIKYNFQSDRVPSSAGRDLTTQVKSLESFNQNVGKFTNNLVLAYEAIDQSRTAGSTVENALLTVASNLTAEFNAAKELIGTTAKGAEILSVGQEAVEDEAYWTENLGINGKLVANRTLRTALVGLAFQKLAANEQTGQSVSVKEFEQTIKAMGANLSDGAALQEVLRGEHRQMGLAVNTHYSLLDKSNEEALLKRFPKARLDKIMQDSAEKMKIEKGPDARPAGQPGQQPPAAPSITQQASEQLQALEQAYRNTPPEQQAARLEAMLQHHDLRVQALGQRLRDAQ